MKEFEFNEWGVCLNPEIVRIDEYIKIELAEGEKAWMFGYYYFYVNTGYGCPCSAKEKAFETKEDALKYAIKRIIKQLEKHIITHKDCDWQAADIKRLKKSIKNLKEKLFDLTHVQLSLFE